jgi:chromosome segregation ATPase
MDEELEKLRSEIVRLNAKIETLKTRIVVCIETIVRLREELESLGRKARRMTLKECIRALGAYDEVEISGLEPP